ncbi:nuclear transport factor 2 family protein [Chitinophaga sp. GCM10012297]|uniref:Nuclear transport factor 2 family protein n=1 Tax=Chitinophaga chungangae TaxID=2821488 RepID=A0ABS3YC65_9BACT|nr:nuclear transport factor 2 family protein [Chitinophaga chungangae]MBO9151734.1 nuclear transport factor 2 family protein [Chitinophaga chungangae]
MQKLFLTVLLLSAGAGRLSAQDNEQALSRLILEKDSLFWFSYNTCDIKAFAAFFSDSVEFYHDKGGITQGLKSLVQSMTDGFCKQPDEFRLRREAVPGTVQVFPLRKNDIIYGAIISGEHYFYINRKGQPERRDGWAKFTHLWLKENGEWKMTRVLSYDHRPAPNGRTAITLPRELLRAYAGRYKGKQTGVSQIEAGEGALLMTTNGKQFTLYPEKENLFFMKERDLTFEFTKTGMIVKENGAIAEELVKE